MVDNPVEASSNSGETRNTADRTESISAVDGNSNPMTAVHADNFTVVMV